MKSPGFKTGRKLLFGSSFRLFGGVVFFLVFGLFPRERQNPLGLKASISESNPNPSGQEKADDPSRPLDPFLDKLILGAMKQTTQNVVYDPKYVGIDYPCGDVPGNRGVCADVLVRAFRNAGIDLQKQVHEDMAKNFSLYPRKWGLRTTDTNIDHRRVLNLMVFFKRQGAELPVTLNPGDYNPGDIVAWDLRNQDGKGLPHIGLVVNEKSLDGERNLVVHNVGGGTVLDDVLFQWQIIGHYQYRGLDVKEPLYCPEPAPAVE